VCMCVCVCVHFWRARWVEYRDGTGTECILRAAQAQAHETRNPCAAAPLRANTDTHTLEGAAG